MRSSKHGCQKFFFNWLKSKDRKTVTAPWEVTGAEKVQWAITSVAFLRHSPAVLAQYVVDPVMKFRGCTSYFECHTIQELHDEHAHCQSPVL